MMEYEAYDIDREEDYYGVDDYEGDLDDEDYDFYDDVDETGFDPYAGCYTYDC